jgi:hypothetical protein
MFCDVTRPRECIRPRKFAHEELLSEELLHIGTTHGGRIDGRGAVCRLHVRKGPRLR